MERTHWVMDLETLSNCFMAVFEDIKTEHREIFVCHESRNDITQFISFLERNIYLNEWHVSFNGLDFDAQIIQYILNDKDQLAWLEGDEVARYVYNKAQYVINKKNSNEFLDFSPKDLKINQVDVFKLNHWDNAAKKSGLKWIQFSMDWDNIIDMPIKHTDIIKADQIAVIEKYCINDVRSTKKIMQLSKSQIDLRGALTKEYNINFFSASEPRISKEIFLHFLSKNTGISKYEIKQLRTVRQLIRMSNVILPYIEFKTAPFQNLLDKLKNLVIYPNETKGGFKYSIRYKGMQTDYGLGGIHGARTSGVYTATDDTIIISSDVVSFYPNLAIRNKWAPEHLPKEEFCALYEWLFEERKKYPKSDPKNYVYKIALNSVYGLSNDENSFLYDPQLTMAITINGELSLSMLYEMICEEIPEAIPLMQNTDGLETIIPKSKVEQYYQICKRWEDLTLLQLEHDAYTKLVLGDVNNYIAVYKAKEVDKASFYKSLKQTPHYVHNTENGKFYITKTKCKGRFEFTDLALHKNKSFLIIPKAIYEYFINGKDPEEYIKECTNIFDFCGGVKIKGEWKFVECFIEKEIDPVYLSYTLQEKKDYLLANDWEQSWSDDNWVRSDAVNKEANTGISTEDAFKKTVPKVGGKYTELDLQNTVRYYISKSGSKILKKNKHDGRVIQVEAGKWMQTVYNKHEPKDISDYNIDYDYYINKVKKEIEGISPSVTQLKLF